jgi:hypothetical protein
MAASLIIEEEQGIFARTPHPHNGYYAGDFTRTHGYESTSTATFATSTSDPWVTGARA